MNSLITRPPGSRAPLLGQAPRTAPGWLAAHAGLVMTVSLGLALLWSYAPILETMFGRFWNDPQYSHGFLVPLFALYLLWHRRQHRPGPAQGPSIWGVPLLA